MRGLGWDSLLRLPRDPPNTLIYPDAVFQFYANLRVENSIPPGCFSTYVDGYLILVTLEMLHLVLGLPNEGIPLASEEDFPLFSFEPIPAIRTLTNNPGGDQWPMENPPNIFQLPDHLKAVHFLITRTLLPRTTNREVVTALDTWILHHAENRIPISYSHLVLAHMIKASSDFSRGDLPFGPLITTLLLRLGLHFDRRYTEENIAVQFRAQHILRHIRWTPANWFFASGIDTDDESDSDGENIPPTYGVPGTRWCAYPTASEYASDLDIDF
ncbi:hypothetical protein LINPERPRIM_LOCUS7265 [Linum perenne]